MKLKNVSIRASGALTPSILPVGKLHLSQGRGISIVPVLPGMCILSSWKYEVVLRT